MKTVYKKLTAVLCAAAIFLLCILSGSALEAKRYLGDIDNDGTVSTADAREILLIALEITSRESLDEEQLLCADVDENGKINSVDARLALLTAIGVEEPEEVSFEFKPRKNELLKKLNEYRLLLSSNELSELSLSDELCAAADDAARIFTEETGSVYINPDGSLYYKALKECGIAFTIAEKSVVESSSDYKAAYKKLTSDERVKKALMSGNYSEIGIGAYSNDGRSFYWCVIFTGNKEV